jgi:hypothetical protein
MLRCYDCKAYHGISEGQIKHLQSLAENCKPPVAKPKVVKGLKRCQTCFKISLNVETVMDAEYECLSCNKLLCK